MPNPSLVIVNQAHHNRANFMRRNLTPQEQKASIRKIIYKYYLLFGSYRSLALPSVVPKTKTNELIQKMHNSLVSRSSLSDFELATLTRESNSLPELDCQYLAKSLVFALKGNKTEAARMACSAITVSNCNPYIASNLIWVMNHIGSLQTVNMILERFNFSHEDINKFDLANIHTSNLFFNKLALYQKLEKSFEKFHQIDSEFCSLYTDKIEEVISMIKEVESRFALQPETIEKISLMAAKIIEKSSDIIPSVSTLDILPESNHASLTFYVECDPSSVFDLNWNLAMALAEENYDDIKCVARFDVLGNDVKPMAERVNVGIC